MKVFLPKKLVNYKEHSDNFLLKAVLALPLKALLLKISLVLAIPLPLVEFLVAILVFIVFLFVL